MVDPSTARKQSITSDAEAKRLLVALVGRMTDRLPKDVVDASFYDLLGRTLAKKLAALGAKVKEGFYVRDAAMSLDDPSDPQAAAVEAMMAGMRIPHKDRVL